jgi:hypothetical protein
MIDEVIHNLEQFDRQSQRLEWSLRLQGASRRELVELVEARENERMRLVALIEGRGDAEH